MRTEKAYIGSTKNLRTRLAEHISILRNGKHYNHDLQSDYDIGDAFSVDILIKVDQNDERKERNALEAYFIILYNTLDNGYNMVYTYQDELHTLEAIRENTEYILLCLEKCGVEDVLEIRP